MPSRRIALATAAVLTVLPATAAGESTGGEGFALAWSRARPSQAFFDARREPRLRYQIRADRPVDLRIRVVKLGGRVVRGHTRGSVTPGERHSIDWGGVTRTGNPAPDGRYRWTIARRGGRQLRAGRFRLRGHEFPVDGPHAYGDRFGAPRSGGRTHEGQDLWAACGTRLVAARGGEVQAIGYSDALYGWYVTLDGRATSRDQLYSHLQPDLNVQRGECVRTGDRIGEVGRSGNAGSEGCQLHFELWPRGRRNGSPIDPLAELRRWDGWS